MQRDRPSARYHQEVEFDDVIAARDFVAAKMTAGGTTVLEVTGSAFEFTHEDRVYVVTVTTAKPTD